METAETIEASKDHHPTLVLATLRPRNPHCEPIGCLSRNAGSRAPTGLKPHSRRSTLCGRVLVSIVLS
jgi:hypothetical protein